MWSDFNLLRESCGLELPELVILLDITPGRARNYDLGRTKCPKHVLDALKVVYRTVERAALTGRQPKGAIARGVARRSLEMRVFNTESDDEWMDRKGLK